MKAQQAAGCEGEVYYFRDEQGLEVDIILSPRESEIVLAECKMSATVSPDMSGPMRRLAGSFRRDGMETAMYLVHNPGRRGRAAPTAGECVSAVSPDGFINAVFGSPGRD